MLNRQDAKNAKNTNRSAREEPDAIVDALATAVINAAYEVHSLLGPGFLESVYEEALCFELQARQIPYQQQATISVPYKGRVVGEGRIDLLVGSRLIVELKAVDTILPLHVAQVISYLKATGESLGLLINFKAPLLKYGLRRVIHS